MRIFTSILFLVVSTTALSQELSGKTFSTANGAIDGYDVVAYFTDEKPVKGLRQHTLKWNDAIWYFASAGHMELFKADPEKYAPQFGGFCSYGISRGYKVKIEANAWTIVDGKLYLNYDQSLQETWRENAQRFISKANMKWTKIASK